MASLCLELCHEFRQESEQKRLLSAELGTWNGRVHFAHRRGAGGAGL